MDKNDLLKIVNSLDKFPGSLSEYSSLKGCNYTIMDTGRPEKFVRLSELELLSTLIDGGCVALIRYEPNLVPYEIDLSIVSGVSGETKLKEFPYGIPVRLR